MASNGVILLNLNNRNAADFQRLEVPDSYEKASGALTAGTYVTVYKWLYQGFMMAPSLCDAVNATDHINLVDRTNGGILKVYPDDTIEIVSADTQVPTAISVRTISISTVDACVGFEPGAVVDGDFVSYGYRRPVMSSEAGGSSGIDIFGIANIWSSGNWILKALTQVTDGEYAYDVGDTIATWTPQADVNFIVSKL